MRVKKFTIQILNVKPLTTSGQKPALFPVIGRKIKPFPKATNQNLHRTGTVVQTSNITS
jgi:hypothetical protein